MCLYSHGYPFFIIYTELGEHSLHVIYHVHVTVLLLLQQTLILTLGVVPFFVHHGKICDGFIRISRGFIAEKYPDILGKRPRCSGVQISFDHLPAVILRLAPVHRIFEGPLLLYIELHL